MNIRISLTINFLEADARLNEASLFYFDLFSFHFLFMNLQFGSYCLFVIRWFVVCHLDDARGF